MAQRRGSGTNQSLGSWVFDKLTKLQVTLKCTPETYPCRTIFMDTKNELAVAEKPHRSDESDIQNEAIIRDYARRFRAGYWVVFGPGSESTCKVDRYDTESPKGHCDKKTLQIVDKHRTARMFLSAFMHCALARILVSSPQHYSKSRS